MIKELKVLTTTGKKCTRIEARAIADKYSNSGWKFCCKETGDKKFPYHVWLKKDQVYGF